MTLSSYQLSEAKWTYKHQYTRPSLVQIMACCLFGAKPLSTPMLAYCWLVGNKFQRHFIQNIIIFIFENWFQNVISKMDSILSWPQCDKNYCYATNLDHVLCCIIAECTFSYDGKVHLVVSWIAHNCYLNFSTVKHMSKHIQYHLCPHHSSILGFICSICFSLLTSELGEIYTL